MPRPSIYFLDFGFVEWYVIYDISILLSYSYPCSHHKKDFVHLITIIN